MATVIFGNYAVNMDDPGFLDRHVPYGSFTIVAQGASSISVEFRLPRPLTVDIYGSFSFSNPMSSTWTGFRMWEGAASARGAMVIELTGLPPTWIDMLLYGSVQGAMDYARQIPDLPFTITSQSFDDGLTGGPAADTLNAGGGNDRLRGLGGNDRLNGGPGADTMEGGPGDDSYEAENAGDQFVEAANEGVDTVFSRMGLHLPDHFENLVLTGAGAMDATGNDLANRLVGTPGANLLDGLGGADTLEGGAGNDTYVVDDPGDVVADVAGGGIDRVFAGASHVLGSHVEELTLTGGADIDGTGNDLPNRITGNPGANVLDGGAGADTMEGGAGDDTYVVDNPGDVVIEHEGGGTDTVRASMSFRAGGYFERVEFTGTAAVEGHGCVADDCVTGNDGDNRLEGLAGDDDLAGGGGTDCLFGGSGDDSIEGGEGNDYLAGGTGDDTVLGGPGDDIVRGWVGDDWLDGGAGADRLRGGPGDDILVFGPEDRCADGGSGFDTLRLAEPGQDLDLTSLPDGRLLGLERIDLAGGGDNTLTLEATDLVALSPDTDELWVEGDAGDAVALAGEGWTDGGVAAGYHTYTDAATGAVAHVDVDLAVTAG